MTAQAHISCVFAPQPHPLNINLGKREKKIIMAMATTQATVFSPSSLSSAKPSDHRLTCGFKQPSTVSFSSKPVSRYAVIRAAAAEGKESATTETKERGKEEKEAPKGFTPPELDPTTPSPIFAGSTGGLLRKAQVEEFYVITWESPKEQIFEMPTGGAAIMREGPNLLKLARKEQCLALGTRLRSKYKIKYQFYRVFPNGEVQYLHPKDGVYPEKVNPGRQGVGQNMRSIGKNVSPIEVKFTGKQPYDL
ncbi:Photosystem I reaction center subunit II chloroplastic [Bienertia sinuspersici]